MSAEKNARIRQLNAGEPDSKKRYVLYWMTAARRVRYNHALDHALAECVRLDLPLVIFEAISLRHRWASARFHRFVIEGMLDNAKACQKAKVRYLASIEHKPGEDRDALVTLAKDAALVVTDDFPGYHYPPMIDAAAKRLREIGVACDVVDSVGLVPINFPEKAYARAVDFRRFLHTNIALLWNDFPNADPLQDYDRGYVNEVGDVRNEVSIKELGIYQKWLPNLPIEQSLAELSISGSSSVATERLQAFTSRVETYGENRNDPDRQASSGFSPYLHFGHLSTFEVLDVLVDRKSWHPQQANFGAKAKREGFWNLPSGIESFLDQILTWRELAYNGAKWNPAFEKYEGNPEWARKTLAEHQDDPRPKIYSLEDLEYGRTYDEIWNAAQRELRQTGVIHNYLRMLWGKRVLEWTESPEVAFDILVHLNNKYAIDGRDPCSYAGIAWVLGRYDRAWGPERPIFGKVRYMSSENTRRKLKLANYLAKFGEQSSLAF